MPLLSLADYLDEDYPGERIHAVDVSNVIRFIEEGAYLDEPEFEGWPCNLPFRRVAFQWLSLYRADCVAYLGVLCEQERPGTNITVYPAKRVILFHRSGQAVHITGRSEKVPESGVGLGVEIETKTGRFEDARILGRVDTEEDRLDDFPLHEDIKTFVETVTLVMWTIALCNASTKFGRHGHQGFIDIAPPPRLNHKRVKKGRRPYKRYKVLHLPGVPIPQTRFGINLPGISRSLPQHWVRSHIAVASKERPVLKSARHPGIIGPHFKPAHLRGNKQSGVVEKDYAFKEFN